MRSFEPVVKRCQAADGASMRSASASVRHADVHVRLGFGRDDVWPRPTAHDPDVDRRPDVVVIQRVQRQHLLRQLVDRADALLRLDTGVRGAALDAHHVVTRALARGLQRAARQR